jgi:hypothetical protein
LPDGTQLRVSWYHPALIYEGQVMCCISEPKTWTVLEDQAKRMQAAWGAKAYMMGFDEIRALGWDRSCEKKRMTPGALIGEAAKRCRKLIAGSTAYVWSDMFDPHHNAVARDYYLVKGDLRGSWEGLPKDVVVVNWNFDKRAESLKFFAKEGHRQVIAGYYDADPAQITKWLDAAKGVEGVEGVMYTTWRGNYADLERFAELVRG